MISMIAVLVGGPCDGLRVGVSPEEDAIEMPNLQVKTGNSKAKYYKAGGLTTNNYCVFGFEGSHFTGVMNSLIDKCPECKPAEKGEL